MAGASGWCRSRQDEAINLTGDRRSAPGAAPGVATSESPRQQGVAGDSQTGSHPPIQAPAGRVGRKVALLRVPQRPATLNGQEHRALGRCEVEMDGPAEVLDEATQHGNQLIAL